jgi:hypothetical protein
VCERAPSPPRRSFVGGKAYQSVHADRWVPLFLREPLLVRKAEQQAAFPHRCYPEHQQLDADWFVLLRECIRMHDEERECKRTVSK